MVLNFNSNVYGGGDTSDDPITCADFDDFMYLINHSNISYKKDENDNYTYSDTLLTGYSHNKIKYIALDPNAENKVIDCNEFSIGQHGLTNKGLRPLCDYANNSLLAIYGNDWIFKNFWYFSTSEPEYFFKAYRGNSNNSTITINKLHFLNFFHSGENHKVYFIGDSYNGTLLSNGNFIFNDCKFSLLTTGGTEYNLTMYKDSSNYASQHQFNRCSFNIISTSPIFRFFGFSNSNDLSYNQCKFTNCNFRLNIHYTDHLFKFGNNGNNNNNYPIFKFCKFTGNIKGNSYLWDNSAKIDGKPYFNGYALNMFMNCIWQINMPDGKANYPHILSDTTQGLCNNNHSFLTNGTNNIPYQKNMKILSKNDLLNIDKLLENNFPVMTKIYEDEDEV